jgi:diaminopimelate decarboxylase
VAAGTSGSTWRARTSWRSSRRRPGGPDGRPTCCSGLARLARPGETLRIEPGRAVTAYCGWYLTRVLDVKRSHGEAFAVVAGGTHHLRTPAAKGHDQPCAYAWKISHHGFLMHPPPAFHYL